MGRAGAAGGPHRPVRAVLRRLSGAPHGHPVLAEGVDGLITPAVDTIPLQLGYYLAILLSCLVGVALLMSVKPLCWLFTGQSFSSACRGVQPVRPVPAEPFQANPGVLITHSRAAHEAALLLNLFLLFFIKFMLTYSLLWRILAAKR